MSQRGFGLVETLVALVVTSVGMLGFAALCGHALAATRMALFRTQAVTLASDMAERIRLNRQGGAAYGGTAASHDCERSGVICAPAQMAAHDLWSWDAEIERQLPVGAEGTVSYVGGVPPVYRIRVAWQEAGAGAAAHEIAIGVTIP